MGDLNDRRVLEAQVAYYRARAAEYDVTSTPDGDPPDPTFDAVRRALREFEPRGRVLELAAGTGQWTGLLAEYADALTATDTSPEMLEINAAKVDDPRITYRVADAFALDATHAWDVVFFGFFLSHVPRDRFDDFWSGVAGLLAPGGRVFFVDEADSLERREEWADRPRDVVWRTLLDGSRHQAVKVLWHPEELEARLRALAWSVSVRAAEPFFYHGTGHR